MAIVSAKKYRCLLPSSLIRRSINTASSAWLTLSAGTSSSLVVGVGALEAVAGACLAVGASCPVVVGAFPGAVVRDDLE